MNVLVRISLEGHNEEINDFIRGVGTFKKAIEFSNICRENNLSIGYSFTINSINEKYFSDMLQLAEDSFADEIEMSEILNVNQNLNISSLMLSEKQSKNFRINTLKGFSISKAFRKGMGLYRYKKGTEYICSAGTKNIFIDINGDVYPCNLFANHNEYFAGNVFSEDLLEIWRKSKVFIELRNLKKEDIEEFLRFAEKEGYADETMQIKSIELSRQGLEHTADMQQREITQKCRLSVGLGAMSGLLILLLLV